ncbi:hypothetical protein A2U01_0028731, partial [Trifolium medium]|nr:hypothetical protein [Trifolium medium]
GEPLWGRRLIEPPYIPPDEEGYNCATALDNSSIRT